MRSLQSFGRSIVSLFRTRSVKEPEPLKELEELPCDDGAIGTSESTLWENGFGATASQRTVSGSVQTGVEDQSTKTKSAVGKKKGISGGIKKIFGVSATTSKKSAKPEVSVTPPPAPSPIAETAKTELLTPAVKETVKTEPVPAHVPAVAECKALVLYTSLERQYANFVDTSRWRVIDLEPLFKILKTDTDEFFRTLLQSPPRRFDQVDIALSILHAQATSIESLTANLAPVLPYKLLRSPKPFPLRVSYEKLVEPSLLSRVVFTGRKPYLGRLSTPVPPVKRSPVVPNLLEIVTRKILAGHIRPFIAPPPPPPSPPPSYEDVEFYSSKCTTKENLLPVGSEPRVLIRASVVIPVVGDDTMKEFVPEYAEQPISLKPVSFWGRRKERMRVVRLPGATEPTFIGKPKSTSEEQDIITPSIPTPLSTISVPNPARESAAAVLATSAASIPPVSGQTERRDSLMTTPPPPYTSPKRQDHVPEPVRVLNDPDVLSFPSLDRPASSLSNQSRSSRAPIPPRRMASPPARSISPRHNLTNNYNNSYASPYHPVPSPVPQNRQPTTYHSPSPSPSPYYPHNAYYGTQQSHWGHYSTGNQAYPASYSNMRYQPADTHAYSVSPPPSFRPDASRTSYSGGYDSTASSYAGTSRMSHPAQYAYQGHNMSTATTYSQSTTSGYPQQVPSLSPYYQTNRKMDRPYRSGGYGGQAPMSKSLLGDKTNFGISSFNVADNPDSWPQIQAQQV